VRRSLPLLAAVAAAVVALDRWTKAWASTALPFDRPIRVLGDYLRLTYTRNSGVAFGIGQGTGFPYYVFSLAAIVVIVWMFVRDHRRAAAGAAAEAAGGTPAGVAVRMSLTRQVSLALILGGAIGNLVDRIASGEVVDFIEVGIPQWHWPVFNVADSAVSVGVVLFALTWSGRHDPATAVPQVGGASPTDPAGGGEPPRPEGLGLERGAAARPLPGGGAEEPLP
jgi:signal peptidase II